MEIFIGLTVLTLLLIWINIAYKLEAYKFMTKAYTTIYAKKNIFIGGFFIIAFLMTFTTSWYENVGKFDDWKSKFEERNINNELVISKMLQNNTAENLNKVFNLNQISRNDSENLCIESFNGKGSKDFEIFSTVVSSIKVLFLSEVDVTCYEQKSKWIIYTAYILVLLSYVLAIFLIFFEVVRNNLIRKNHSVVIGLNNYSAELIKNLTKENVVKVYESDKFNPLIEQIKEFGAIVITKSFSEVVKKDSDIYKANEIFIMDENDGLTLNYLSELTNSSINNSYFENKPKIYVQIENRDNRLFFEKNGIFKLSDTNQDYDLVLISIDEIIAHRLFEKRCLTENFIDKPNQDKSLQILIVGFNNLVEEIVYHILKIGHFTGEEPICITVVDDNYEFLNSKYSDWKKIGLSPYNNDDTKQVLWKLNFVSKNSLYENSFYVNEKKHFNFDRVIIADKNNDVSVNVLSYLNKRFYSILNKQKVIIQLYNIHNFLNKTIDNNSDTFNLYYTFGAVEVICKPDLIRNSNMSKIAEITNNYKEDLIKEPHKEWNKLDSFTRESNITEKQHMNIKLHYLGLKLISDNKIKNFNNYEEIVKKYKEKILNLPSDSVIKDILELPYFKELVSIKLDNNKEKKLSKFNESELIEKFKIAYAQNDLICLSCIEFSKYNLNLNDDIFKNKIKKLAIIEHTRWNVIHLLNGWSKMDDHKHIELKKLDDKEKYEKFKKENKLHINLCDFKTLEEQESNKNMKMSVIKYDYKNIYQIPFVAFSLGYKIEKMNDEEQK